MNSNIDFVTRAHALWRVRMAQWQQRFRFFSARSSKTLGGKLVRSGSCRGVNSWAKISRKLSFMSLIRLVSPLVGIFRTTKARRASLSAS